MSETIASVIIFIGSIFLFLASLGVLRMPDSYNRIQTGTKATTLGLVLILIGVGILHPMWFSKIIILIFFVLLTNPVSSHALAKAAHLVGIKMSDDTVIDQLKLDEQKQVHQKSTAQNGASNNDLDNRLDSHSNFEKDLEC